MMPLGSCSQQDGMTLRQWFAGQALAGISANPDISKSAAEHGLNPAQVRLVYAEAAAAQADALIAALEKREGGGV